MWSYWRPHSEKTLRQQELTNVGGEAEMEPLMSVVMEQRPRGREMRDMMVINNKGR
jgi:hypothetical protein